MNRILATLLPAACAATAAAQTAIDATNKFSWSENCGWMNWADPGAVPGDQAVAVFPTFLAGFVWCENAGYVNVGDGTPTNGASYANVIGADFGVNILPDGTLSGLGWGENIGWINFNTAPTLAAFGQQARLDAQRFRGYAWGENVGWINLDDAVNYVGLAGGGPDCTRCPADYNLDGGVDGTDIQDFFADWEAATGCSDTNQDGGIDGADIDTFFQAWEAGGC
ncbi:MAG: hypothetical protein JSR77_02645 [Planctomycetes bacterium]|nr:hypothetical protein [Planctomycetota bacterium]